MIKVLFDTEVFVNGLVNPHAPFPALFDLPSDHQLMMSDVIFSEVLDVLRRSETVRKALPAVLSISLPDIFSNLDVDIATVPPSMTLNICKRQEDNKFLASAMYMECDLLVTDVPDLVALEGRQKWLDFKRNNGIPCRIVRVEEFLTSIGKV